MKRFRDFRKDQATRDKYADVSLSAADFIYPYFVVEGENQKEEISTMPGVYRFSIDTLLKDIKEIKNLGINKVLLFGVIPDEQKDERGSAAYADDALIARAVKAIKAEFGKDIIVFTDVCLCEYTNHGHCGLLHHHDVDNDSTLPLLAEEAYVHAKAGADFVAPSAMMDGQVEAIKKRLKEGVLDKQCRFSHTLPNTPQLSMVHSVMQQILPQALETERVIRWTSAPTIRVLKRSQPT